MTSEKPTVLVVGATGRTGVEVSRALLRHGDSTVLTLVRPSSLSKPAAQELKSLGAQLRIGDISDTPDQLETHLKGVDVLIITTLAIVDQKPIILAAKKAGVKRVVPSDFGPSCERGVMWMHDVKLDIRDFIKSLSLGHTFIEVGMWTQQLFPYPHSYRPNPIEEYSNHMLDEGKTKMAYTSLRGVGEFVARIVIDPKTLNQTVICWDGEASLSEGWNVAGKAAGEDFSDCPRVSKQDIEAHIANAPCLVLKVFWEYGRLFAQGGSTLADSKARGALDVRALYPEYEPISMEEEAERFYANPPKVDVAV